MLILRLMFKIAEHRTMTELNPIKEKIKLDALLVNTFRSKVFVTMNPIKNIVIKEIVITIVHVVKFASLILFDDFIISVFFAIVCYCCRWRIQLDEV